MASARSTEDVEETLESLFRQVYGYLMTVARQTVLSEQEESLRLAYNLLVNFYEDTEKDLDKVQKAAIAITRDEISKLQMNLEAAKTNGESEGRLDMSVSDLENTFTRFNKWRADSDPMKEMSLDDYINGRNPTAEIHNPSSDVSVEDDTADPRVLFDRRLGLDAAEVCAEIERIGMKRGGFANKGLWIGINNATVCMNGRRLPGDLLVSYTEDEWGFMNVATQEIAMEWKMLKPPEYMNGSKNCNGYVCAVTQPTEEFGMLAVIWYGAVMKDNNGDGAYRDPRAHVLPSILCGVTWPTAHVAIFGQFMQVDISTAKTGEEEYKETPSKEMSSTPVSSPVLPVASHTSDASDSSHTSHANTTNRRPMETGVTAQIRREACEVDANAASAAQLNDYRIAYELSIQAKALRDQADAIDAANDAEDDEYVKKPPALSVASMSKYESPLTRSYSQAESITGAEALSSTIAQRSSQARTAMATVHSRESSKQSSKQSSKRTSPQTSPPVELPKEGPPLPAEVLNFALPASLG